MIDQSAEEGKAVEVQCAQYEGLIVWINALIASAGGQIVEQDGNVMVNDTATRAAEIESKLANSPAAPPGMSTNNEDEARFGFYYDRSNYLVNYTYIYPSAEAIEGCRRTSAGRATRGRTRASRASRHSAASTSASRPTQEPRSRLRRRRMPGQR